MPEIRCPRCQTKLSVPRKLLGTPVNCPRCAQPFMASAVAGGGDSASLSSGNLGSGNPGSGSPAGAAPATNPLLPPNAGGAGSVAIPPAPAAAHYAFPPGMTAPNTNAGTVSNPAAPASAVPTITSVPLPAVPESSLLPPGAVPASSQAAASTVPKAVPLPPAGSNPALRHNPWKNDTAASADASRAAAGSKTGQKAMPVPAVPATSSALPAANDAATAKVIRAAPAQDTLALSSDGKLSGLQLAEEREKPRRNFAAWKSNPVLIAVLFCFSMGSTVAMLLMEPSESKVPPATKAEVREKLKPYYAPKPNGALLPYQLDLRRALQAYSSGDFKTEKSLYRKVLKRLQAEKPQPYSNLTGSMEQDDQLIEYLSILIRKD